LKNILYIRPLSTNTLGAEEKDLEAGFRILNSMDGVNVFNLFIDLKTKKILSNIAIDYIDNSGKSIEKFSFFIRRILVLDNSLREAYSFGNYKIIEKLCVQLNINIIFTNTTCTFLYGRYSKIDLIHIHRSVMFEPVYVLKSVRNPFKALIHSLIIIFTVYIELGCDKLISISPRDQMLYSRAAKIFRKKKSISYIPLRQFYKDMITSPIKSIRKPLSIGFLGSTYNVLHNKLSLEFILKNLDSNFLTRNEMTLNIYGRKIPNLINATSSVFIHNWEINLVKIYEDNDVFVVPFFLGSGMQSKVFETLFAGRLLLCDNRVLAGNNLIKNVDYLHAKSGADFRKKLIWITKNQHTAMEIAQNGNLKARSLIGPDVILNNMNRIFLE